MSAHIPAAIARDGISKTSGSPAIELRGLSKMYRPRASRPVRALVHVTLSVRAGEVVGVLGTNGAGKTTLVKLIAGMLRPSAGQVLVRGYDGVRERGLALRQIGAAIGAREHVRSRVSVREHLLPGGEAMDGKGPELPLRAVRLLHELELWEWRDAPLHTLSSTMQGKVALARALLADPPVVVLDEPTLGLDARAARAVQQWIAQLAHEQGKTVLLTTYQPKLASALCDRVVLMQHGRLVADVAAADLRTLMWGSQYQIRVKGQLGSQWSEWFGGLAVLPAGGDETILRGTIADQAALHGVIGKVRDLGLPLLTVTREELSLDDLLARLTQSVARRFETQPERYAIQEYEHVL